MAAAALMLTSAILTFFVGVFALSANDSWFRSPATSMPSKSPVGDG